ncbi:hypothetical protein HO173_007368 [Letharia columbiana]|uniref:Uncharacterized protein n=1 Tax=Letharia columbiana TaxID=112416 RepID=A0A8H6L3L5_9LECA|nr:uncharacterized protein HO173_007368 [Letharia columbiana]KAF6234335.1 hypothetical protein HO173_007368 [Letharia columbiana]
MNPFFVAVKQALISTGRDPSPNGCPEEAKLAKSDQSRLRKVKTSRNNVSRYESLDTPNTPNTSGSDPRAFSEPHPELKPRQAAWQADTPTTDVSTCGYLNGNASLPRTANPGFDCRVDNKNAIWGFCSTAILAVSDCGLVGGCVDAHACDGGCGISGDPNATTVGCTDSGADYCSTALLTDGPDQTYAYIACGSAAITDNLLYSPTTTSLHSSPSTTSALSRAKPSVTSASSTSSATSSSPIPTTSTITSAPASSSTHSKATSSTSNNTGAIVGGVLGGLALLAFIVVAMLFHRRLKTSPTTGGQSYDPVWQGIGDQRGAPKRVPRQTLHPAELSTGRRDETTELPNDMEGTRRT